MVGLIFVFDRKMRTIENTVSLLIIKAECLQKQFSDGTIHVQD